MTPYRLDLRLTPPALALIAGAQSWPARATLALCKQLDLQNQLTIGYAQARKLSKRGPKTLGVRTNRLRPSLNAPAARPSGDSIISSIGTNVRYAGVHEFGFVGVVQVKAFDRQVHQYAGGQKLVAHMTAAGRIVKKKSKVTASATQHVKAHQRKMSMPERSYIRSSLSERSPEYSAGLSAALVAALSAP